MANISSSTVMRRKATLVSSSVFMLTCILDIHDQGSLRGSCSDVSDSAGNSSARNGLLDKERAAGAAAALAGAQPNEVPDKGRRTPPMAESQDGVGLVIDLHKPNNEVERLWSKQEYHRDNKDGGHDDTEMATAQAGNPGPRPPCRSVRSVGRLGHRTQATQPTFRTTLPTHARTTRRQATATSAADHTRRCVRRREASCFDRVSH